MDPIVLIVAAGLLLGGLVKGAVGIGQPTAAILVTANFTDPFTALALNTLPMLVTNLMQMREAPDIGALLKRDAGLIGGLCLGLAIAAAVVVDLPENAILLVVGLAVSVYCLLELTITVPRLRLGPGREQAVGCGVGLMAGFLGGVSTLWAPPLLLFYAALGLSKDEFVRRVGLVLFLGAIVLTGSYIANGILSADRSLWSALAIIPTVIGFIAGRKLRASLSQENFRWLLLIVFLVGGLILAGRALSGASA